MLVEMGSDVHARTLGGDTPLHWAESNGQEAVVIFLRNNAENKQRVLSFGWCFGVFFAVVSAVLVQLGVFPPIQVQVLILVLGVILFSVPDRFVWCLDEFDAINANMASSSGRRDASRHSEPAYVEIFAHGGEENAGPAFNVSGQGRPVAGRPQFMAGQSVTGRTTQSQPVECEPGTSHNRVEQRTTTHVERR